MVSAAILNLVRILGTMAMSYLPVIILDLFLDGMDEAMQTLFDKWQKSAEETPDQTDNRRLALVRKYWEGWESYRKRRAG